MIQKINNTKGQTALILILLTAAALIFLAITMNWGRVAQVKAMLSISANESASSLASDTASYGELQKQTYLQNANFKSALTGVLLSVIVLIVSIILACIPATAPAAGWLMGFAIAGMVMTFVTIVLQLVWINPMISALWNNLQKNQPVQQQFYEEGGISTALQGAVTDQVNITDYFDWNANGAFGNNTSGLPNDIVSRFAVFYTDRLKMLNQPLIPQVVFFYDQLGELVNGETCAQNAIDSCLNSSIPLNSQCPSDCAISYTANNSCVFTSSDPACQLKVPNGFQLNDACAVSIPGISTYNPYCDPCCQPVSVPNAAYCNPSTTSSTTSNGSPSTTCTGTTSTEAPCNCNPLVSPYIALRPSNCPTDTSANGAPAQCRINNPYNTKPGSNDSIYTLLYDPTYQNYSNTNNPSFLDQFGRDQQAPLPQPPGSPPQPPQQLQEPPFTPLTLQGNFPNGIYPFFWLMKDYSPEVDNINPTITPVTSSQYHWCTSAISAPPGYIPLTAATLTAFPDLAQLTLAYACSGQDCCVDGLANSVTGGVPTIATSSTTNGVTTPAPPSWVIDAVDSPSLASNTLNPALDPSFGEGGSGTWLEGDNQMCSATWPYNGSTSSIPDGTCEWNNTAVAPTNMPPPNPNVSTVDSLDDTMHVLSDFVTFANSLLGQDVGTLSASFATWYPQAAVWIAPVGSTDYPQGGRLLPVAPNLNAGNKVITNWLNNNYTSSGAWCVPSEQTLLNGNTSTTEDTYINTNGGTGPWGDLPHVIACLNYNASPTPAGLYQACQQWLQSSSCSSASALTGTPCDPVTLGRSLELQPTTATWSTASCGTVTTPYTTWVNDSLTLATDEAPKFTLRSAFLTDVQTRAKSMQNIFSQGAQEIQNFLNGPAAQLTAASQTQPIATLPNAVIYGWQDNPPPSGTSGGCMSSTTGLTVGCWHIVKVTAYAAGRNGSGSTANSIAQALLPWIKTTVHLFTRDFELRSRDGYVYVSVKRWDQDHSSSLLFPNGRPLWQFLFHKPNGGSSTTTGQGISTCLGSAYQGALSGKIGIGLELSTVQGLGSNHISSTDQTALGNAFMLNFNPNDTHDPNASTGGYSTCLAAANAFLASAPESHACVEYVASSPASDANSVTSGSSAQGDADYALKFVDCSTVPGFTNESALEDLK